MIFNQIFSPHSLCFILSGYSGISTGVTDDPQLVRSQNITVIDAWVHPKFTQYQDPSIQSSYDMAILILEREIEPLAFTVNAAAVATFADLSDDQAQNLKLLGYGESRP